MSKTTLICSIIFHLFTFISAQLCTPTDIEYSSVDNLIYLSWSYDEENFECTGGQFIILSEPGTETTYFYNGYGAIIDVPYPCSTYKIGILPYSEGGVTGPVQYINVTTETPSYINMDYVSIKENDTYIFAEWAPEYGAKNCFDEYQIVVSFTNTSSPSDNDSFQKMYLIHRQTTTTFDIMPIEDCVNITINIVVAPYYNGFTGQQLIETYICS